MPKKQPEIKRLSTAKGPRKELVEVVPPLTKKATMPKPGVDKVAKKTQEEVKSVSKRP